MEFNVPIEYKEREREREKKKMLGKGAVACQRARCLIPFFFNKRLVVPCSVRRGMQKLIAS